MADLPPTCPCITLVNNEDIKGALSVSATKDRKWFSKCCDCVVEALEKERELQKAPKADKRKQEADKRKQDKSAKEQAPVLKLVDYVCITCARGLCEKHMNSHYFDLRSKSKNHGSNCRGRHCLFLVLERTKFDRREFFLRCQHCNVDCGNGISLATTDDAARYVEGIPVDSSGYAIDEGGEYSRNIERCCTLIMDAIGGTFPGEEERAHQRELENSEQSRESTKRRQKEKAENLRQIGIMGLQNLGNTCFFNATMQCLSKISVLGNAFGNMDTTEFPGPLSRAFASFLVTMGDISKGVIFHPRNLFQQVCSRNRMFGEYVQQDAEELLSALLNGMAEEFELHHAREQCPAVSEVGGTLETSFRCHSCGTVSTKREPFFDLSISFVSQAAEGRMEDMICKYFEPSLLTGENGYACERCCEEAFNEKMAQLAKAKSDELLRVSQLCSQPTIESDRVSNGDNSDSEGEIANQLETPPLVPEAVAPAAAPLLPQRNRSHYVDATMQSRLLQLKNVIIIHIKRFVVDRSGQWGKDQRWVAFPFQLELSGFLAEVANSTLDPKLSALHDTFPKMNLHTLQRFLDICSGNVDTVVTMLSDGVMLNEEVVAQDSAAAGVPHGSYRLRGVVEHIGSCHGGHYVAYVHHASRDTWYLCSDTEISCSSREQVARAQAYLLFYER